MEEKHDLLLVLADAPLQFCQLLRGRNRQLGEFCTHFSALTLQTSDKFICLIDLVGEAATEHGDNVIDLLLQLIQLPLKTGSVLGHNRRAHLSAVLAVLHKSFRNCALHLKLQILLKVGANGPEHGSVAILLLGVHAP